MNSQKLMGIFVIATVSIFALSAEAMKRTFQPSNVKKDKLERMEEFLKKDVKSVTDEDLRFMKGQVHSQYQNKTDLTAMNLKNKYHTEYTKRGLKPEIKKS